MFYIHAKELNSKVKRRPSDFEWLAQILQKEFPGYLIPPVFKTQEKLTDDATVVEQIFIFKKFLDDCLQNPELRYSLALEAFLMVQNYEEFKDKKKELDRTLDRKDPRVIFTKKNLEFYRQVGLITFALNHLGCAEVIGP